MLSLLVALALSCNLLLAGSFTVLTQNAFLAEVNQTAARTMKSRLGRFPKRILSLEKSPDLIGFEEFWGSHFRNEIGASLRKRYPHQIWQSELPTFTPANEVAATSAAVGIGTGAGTYLVHRSCAHTLTRRAFMAVLGSATLGFETFGAFGFYMDQKLRDWGNGLFLLTRTGNPIRSGVQSMYFNPWTRPEEMFLFKGALRATVAVADFGDIDVYLTHLGAMAYEPQTGTYQPRDVVNNENQARELVDWIRATQKKRLEDASYSGVYLVMGDFNQDPYEIRNGKFTHKPTKVYELLTGRGERSLGLTDTYRFVNGDEIPLTYSPKNPLVAEDKQIPIGDFSNFPGESIDYIFVSDSNRLRPVQSYLVSDDANPISDHSGVQTEFLF